MLVFESCCDQPPAPGLRQTEPVQMRDVPIAAVRHRRRLEQCLWLAPYRVRKKVSKPIREAIAWQNPRHQRRLHEAWRQKIRLRRLSETGVHIGVIPLERLVCAK